jgi:hypothetical protein
MHGTSWRQPRIPVIAYDVLGPFTRNARPRVIRGTRAKSLPLLPSGPGGVYNRPLHEAQSLTIHNPIIRITCGGAEPLLAFRRRASWPQVYVHLCQSVGPRYFVEAAGPAQAVRALIPAM